MNEFPYQSSALQKGSADVIMFLMVEGKELKKDRV